MDLNQYLNLTSAAKYKGFLSNSLFLYHASKEGAPKPVVISGVNHYLIADLDAWQPKTKAIRTQT